ncbi:MAG: prepilin-type N-terminal cleavage/methylation domain-containing protein [Planctomycetota bacterium]
MRGGNRFLRARSPFGPDRTPALPAQHSGEGSFGLDSGGAQQGGSAVLAASAKSRRTAASRQSGFSLIESMVAMAVVFVAVGGALSSIAVTSRLSESSVDSNAAYGAAQALIEQLRAEDFDSVFARFNATGADDPDGVDTAPGASFDVLGLEALPGDADGLAGAVSFPVDPLAPGVLREDVQLLGRDFDLDLDGAIDANDKAASYQLLPLEVRVDWQSSGGPRSIQIQTVLLRP